MFSGRKCAPMYNPKGSLGRLLYERFLKNPENFDLVSKFHSIIKDQLQDGQVLNSIVPGLDPDDEQLIHLYMAAIPNGNPIHFIDFRSGEAEVDNAVQVTKAKTISLPEEECSKLQDGKRML